jgi:hypothetical protein
MPPEGGSPDQIRTIIQEELAAAGKGGNGANGQKKKFEPEEINQKLHTMEKLLAAMANALGVSLPPEALVSDNPETGEEVVPEGNQPAPTEDNLQLGGGPPSGGAYAGVKDQPMDSAIKPVDPIQPAMPEVPKMAEAVPSVGTPIDDQYVSPRELLTKTSALAHMARRVSSGSENATS